MIERYEITGKIGQGGVGAVYRAYDHQLGRVVALKRLLPPDESELDDAPDQLLAKEASLMSSITHPNIIGVYDAGVDADGAFVVMEYIDGETLEDTISRGALTEEDFISLAEQCLDGLIAAQEIGMLHRDIKPTNLMIRWLPTGRFQVKIVDFGLAKLTFKPTIQTIAHGDAILGSIYFLAPEQFERRPLDKRTDLYALGSVFYYALTQQYPFHGDTAAAVMMAHLEHRATPLEQLRPDLSQPVLNWVNRLISRDMEDRPDHAAAAMMELATATGGKAGTIHHATSHSAPAASAHETPAPQATPVAEPVIPIVEPDIPVAEPVIPFAELDIPLAEAVFPIAEPVEKPEPQPAQPSDADSKLITSRKGSASRKLITSSVSTLAANRVGVSSKSPTTANRLNQAPVEDTRARPMKRFGVILACAVPVVLLLLFILLRSRS